MTHTGINSPRIRDYRTINFAPRFNAILGSRRAEAFLNSRAASSAEVLFLMHLLRRDLGQVASDSAALRVARHDPCTFQIVERPGAEPGFLAYLPLNARGYAALLTDTLDTRAPDLDLLAARGEAPIALYIWCVHAPGSFIPVIGAVAAHLAEIAPQGIPLFTRAATPAAARLFDALGFASATHHFPRAADDLLVVFPADKPTPLHPLLTTRVTRTIEDVMKVFAIRAATYMNEQACPYDEEFDGNDFCAAHILGEIDGEPAGCIRVRFFGDFVKIERLAVRPEFRHTRLAMKLARAAFDYARTKGFRKAYGHSRHDLVRFWSRFGFRPIPDRATFQFSDVDYIEIEADIAPANDVIAIGRPPLEMIRPEGDWDRPGPLDRSAARGSKREHLKHQPAKARG